jgi:hypothetical protein
MELMCETMCPRCSQDPTVDVLELFPMQEFEIEKEGIRWLCRRCNMVFKPAGEARHVAHGTAGNS